MKIAKLMLISSVIFAAVGGAFALKAKNFSSKYCIGTCDGVNTDVPTFGGAHKFTNDPNAPSLLVRTTNLSGLPITEPADCVDLTTVTTNCFRFTTE